MLGTIILFLLVLSLLVFVHEFGHFITAKKQGMKVDEFGFGFPPRMFGIKKGETTYSVNWIPLGGFVKIKGESGEHKHDPDSFASHPAWRRFIVLFAGVAMNLVLAAFLLSIGFLIGLPGIVDGNISASANLSDEQIRIITILPDSPAEEAGIESGDVVLSINDTVFATAEEARTYVGAHTDEELAFMLQRDEDFVEIGVQAGELETGTVGVGVGMVKTALISYPVHLAVVNGVAMTGVFTWEVVKGFWGLIESLVVRQEVSVDLSGPVGIAVLTGEVAALGFVYLLQFTAILSINLAVLNVLPFPALDGGRILFLIIEKIRRGKVNQRIEAVAHNFGFLLLMVLVILVTYRDIVRFGGDIWGSLKNLVGM